MAVPKHKTSKARRNSRHSANSVAVMPTLVECPKCHGKKLSKATLSVKVGGLDII